ncbi:MAG: imidazole glycerol phosphate synthase subunit HisH [Candidatus Pristimantibacillus lignocellulolyticus]|uniref:Imidazole glycerol phosphate synthase subunit HisH n=1 Tax=Candidatus Pristimantibacillus lignocellulolyticus TaxID=2994561 RepID=A0A9J6ZH53_9BACL|nr:MAG: imidazole glycerol phosphate synthase subunit HisH [Candidatus Pristimantibacillus lignocellulolyticus]
MIVIIDYGMGNLHSVSKAVERLGYEAVVTGDAEMIFAADAVILPGVGAYGDAMQHLSESGLDDVTKQFAATGKPLLGICLGMQLLFEQSEEYGIHKGLGLLEGEVIRFKGDFKIPHMGWNKLQFLQESPLFTDLTEGHVYFVHSYHALPKNKENLLATGDYYGPVTAIVGKNNVYGMQFHPEKSGELGMQLLQNFLTLTGSSKRGL